MNKSIVAFALAASVLVAGAAFAEVELKPQKHGQVCHHRQHIEQTLHFFLHLTVALFGMYPVKQQEANCHPVQGKQVGYQVDLAVKQHRDKGKKHKDKQHCSYR